nr:hypothetical protein [Gemmatimonadaceae bacterium]
MDQNQEIINRYIGQPTHLPGDLRSRIEREWSDQPVQLYALADLDSTLQLGESWLALGPEHVALARPGEGGMWDVQSVERTRIRAVRESPGLSANTLLLLGVPNDPPLAVVRYTQRQRGAFENIRFVLDEALAGRTVTSLDADGVYADAVARPVRDAQALVAGRESAVLLRLLGYLTRYRRQLAFGLSAAAVVTLASLVPPYLAGYLIDGVVRRAQEGTLERGAAVSIAWIVVGTMAVLYVLRQTAAHVR